LAQTMLGISRLYAIAPPHAMVLRHRITPCDRAVGD
jgi:hypothetical protein